MAKFVNLKHVLFSCQIHSASFVYRASNAGVFFYKGKVKSVFIFTTCTWNLLTKRKLIAP